MIIWRLVFEDGKVMWFGPVHTYTLCPEYAKEDRLNW